VESADSEGFTPPEPPTIVDSRFPDCLTPEIRIIFDATEKKRSQLWTTPSSREVVDEYEEMVGQLVASSREMPTSPAIVRYMRWNEEERTSEHRSISRLPIPIDYGWHEYYSLVLDDEANLDREVSKEVRKSGNLWIYWAKELVGMLPAVTKRAVELGKHPISDIPKDRLPESLRVLFEQAHLCYLFNLEIPCAMTCGSLIEEAIETRFPELSGKWEEWSRTNGWKQVGWKFKKTDLLEVFPRFGEVSRKADNVVYERNDAVHNPDKFLHENRGGRASILRDTRDVLENLFEVDESAG
jgi:hypothetical protein